MDWYFCFILRKHCKEYVVLIQYFRDEVQDLVALHEANALMKSSKYRVCVDFCISSEQKENFNPDAIYLDSGCLQTKLNDVAELLL